MFLPTRRIALKNMDVPTEENSGYFVASIPQPNLSTVQVIEHSSALMAMGCTYDSASDSWQMWLGSVIRTYRRAPWWDCAVEH